MTLALEHHAGAVPYRWEESLGWEAGRAPSGKEDFDASDREEDAATEVVVVVVLARAGAARLTRAVEALTASVSDMLLCKIRAWGVRRACDARSGCTG